MIANDLGDRVTPAVVAFTDHDEVSRAFFIILHKNVHFNVFLILGVYVSYICGIDMDLLFFVSSVGCWSRCQTGHLSKPS